MCFSHCVTFVYGMINSFEKFISELSEKLKAPLPGMDAQKKLEPVTRRKYGERYDASRARLSGTMTLFHSGEDDVMITFIRRTEYNGVHSGQIGFPGGRYEENDKSLLDTALRETHEEIGIPSGQIRVIGKLTRLYIPPSNFIVEPWVGYLINQPKFIPEPSEVDQIFSIPLSELLKDDCLQSRPVRTDNTKVEVPCFYVNEKMIWGATSMILNELLELIRA